MADTPTTPAVVIDAGSDGIGLTIVGEPDLAGMQKRFPNIGAALAAAIPLAFSHRLELRITADAIGQHVFAELRAEMEARQ